MRDDYYHDKVWPGQTPLQAYEASVRRTMGANERSDALACYGLGVAGEAGEVADIVKKHLFHGHDLDEDHMKKELGDVLWYVTALALTLGTTLEEVMVLNKAKLEARYPGGFSKEASRGRGDFDKP